MKVSIYETVQVSDEQRVALARLLDDEGSRKRQATRDELKSYIWLHGANWEQALASGLAEPLGAGAPEQADADAEEDLEDLLGTAEDDTDDSLEDLL